MNYPTLRQVKYARYLDKEYGRTVASNYLLLVSHPRYWVTAKYGYNKSVGIEEGRKRRSSVSKVESE